MADGIFRPWNVARSWHWFHQVTAPCNVACGSGITTVNSPSGSTLQCDMWLWDDMPLNSPAPCSTTRSSWIMTLNLPGGTVAAPCNVANGSGMTCHLIRPNVRHIGILHLVSISTISPQSTCHSTPVCEMLYKSDHPRQKKMTSCRFSRWRISAILDFRGPIMGSMKSPCTTSYRSSIETTALNCLVFEKIAFFCILATDRQTDKQTDKQMDSIDGLSRCRCRERRLNNMSSADFCDPVILIIVTAALLRTALAYRSTVSKVHLKLAINRWKHS